MTTPSRPPADQTGHAARWFKGAATRIGIFDSGLGGLSVLRAIRARLPQADLIYVADSGHAPYGERDSGFIVSRSQHICDFLTDQGVHAIVVACNTATAAAIHLLREAHPHTPLIGVEPGVKPALALSANKRVGVLATPSTLASAKFKRLIDNHGAGAMVLPQACPGLAREIEQGQLDTPALRALIEQFAAPLRAANVDTVVLGCTHYPFVAPLVAQALGPQVHIVDTAAAVAEHTARVCAQKLASVAVHATPSSGQIQLWSSGRPEHLTDVARHWLGLQTRARLFS